MGSQEGRDEKGKFQKGNKISVGNKGGRPPKFETPEQLDQMVDAYLKHCEENLKPLSVTGLCLFLGFNSRDGIYYYRDNKPEFSDSIKKALLYVEEWYEHNLNSKAATGAIFALKNFGWKDRKEIDAKGEMSHTFTGFNFLSIDEEE